MFSSPLFEYLVVSKIIDALKSSTIDLTLFTPAGAYHCLISHNNITAKKNKKSNPFPENMVTILSGETF